MDFKQLDIYTESEGIQLLTVRLEELGITGFVIHDKADFNEFLNNKDANWDYIDDSLMNLKDSPVYITAYVQDDEQGREIVNAVCGVLDELRNGEQSSVFGELRLEIDSVSEEDWENNWKQYYKPFRIGNHFIIKPTWEKIENTVEKNMLILEIDPASSFGTGQHATTRLCIESLEKIIFAKHCIDMCKNNVENEKLYMLDIGCGSGILSIASLLLGVNSVTMTDIFENALRTASSNIEQNGFSKTRYNVFCGNITEDASLREKIKSLYGGFDIITANIVADVIIPMSMYFNELIKDNGLIVLSGIITERLDEVKQAVQENGLEIMQVNEQEGWNAVVCRRRERPPCRFVYP